MAMNSSSVESVESVESGEPGAPSDPSCACTGGKACPTVSLCGLRPGQGGVIASADLAADDALLLAAMGLAVGSRVVMCRVGEPCIVAVVSGITAHEGTESCRCASRIGLARPLASKIQVTPLTQS